MKRFLSLVILGACLVAAGFAYPGLGSLTMDQQAIATIFEKYIEYQEAGDADTFITLWDVDGVKLSAGVPMKFGSAAIHSALKATLAKFKKDFDLNLQEIVVFGDYAFARGVFTVVTTPKDGGASTFGDGKFMTVLRKQPDGRWLIYRDVTNSNLPAK